MSIGEIRERLMVYIAEADDRKLEALYTILQPDLQAQTYSLTEEQLQMVEERRGAYKTGKRDHAEWKELLQQVRENRTGK